MCKQFVCERCGKAIYGSGYRIGDCEHYKSDEIKVERLFDYYPASLKVEKARVEYE